ncbi:MAG: lipopolysaccharide heptosyltransferase family protein [Alphaproteobacteria bacterium]|nr:lipopolysaccharide heptosyltransferase family protein [Alphaproteobacteria bacterium]
MNDDSILVYVGLDLVGDGLLKLPFVRILRANWPKARIVWCAGKGSSVFASSLRPLVAGLIDETIENAGFGSRLSDALGRPLAGRTFDLVIDTQRRFATSLAVRRVRHRRFVSGAAGFLLSGGRPANADKPRSMHAQLLQLVEAAGGNPAIPVAPLSLPAEAQADASALLPPGPRYVGLAPGAGNRAKSWPLDRFVALARGLRDATPVFILGPDERDWTDACRAVPGAILPLQDAAARGIAPSPVLTIALAQRLTASVANDSGGGHMLAAGDGALVSLFGPTDPAKFAPVAKSLVVLRAQDFGGEMMDAIPLEAVEAALQSSMAGTAAR